MLTKRKHILLFLVTALLGSGIVSAMNKPRTQRGGHSYYTILDLGEKEWSEIGIMPSDDVFIEAAQKQKKYGNQSPLIDTAKYILINHREKYNDFLNKIGFLITPTDKILWEQKGNDSVLKHIKFTKKKRFWGTYYYIVKEMYINPDQPGTSLPEGIYFWFSTLQNIPQKYIQRLPQFSIMLPWFGQRHGYRVGPANNKTQYDLIQLQQNIPAGGSEQQRLMLQKQQQLLIQKEQQRQLMQRQKDMKALERMAQQLHNQIQQQGFVTPYQNQRLQGIINQWYELKNQRN